MPEPKVKPQILIESAENTDMSNYPFSVEAAQSQIEEYLAAKLKQGYRYGGIITRDVGPERREFYVFYLTT